MSEPSALYSATAPDGRIWRLELHQDPDVDSPRENDGNLGTIVYSHRNYNLGDERLTNESMVDYLERKGVDPIQIVSLPVYLMDHSGLSLSTTPFSCQWDSGQVGAIYATLKDVEENYGDAGPDGIEKALICLRAEIDEMNKFISGETYYFNLTCEPPQEDQEVDSVGGFIGGDPRTNGMLDHIDIEVADLLRPVIASRLGNLNFPDPDPVSSSIAPSAPLRNKGPK